MKKKKYIGSIGLFLVLFLITYGFVFKDYSVQTLLFSLRNCLPEFILLAILLLVFWAFCDALYLKRILYHLGYKITWFHAFGYICTLSYFSAITPSSIGGQPVQMLEMNKDDIPYEMNIIVVLLNTVFYKVALILLATIAFILYHKQLFSFNTIFTLLAIVGFVTTIFVIIVFFAMIYSKKVGNFLVNWVIKILRKIPFVKNVDKKEEKLNQALQDYQKCSNFTKKHPKVLVETFLIMLVGRIANLAISYAIYLAFGLHNMSIFQVLAFQICITLRSRLYAISRRYGCERRNAFRSQ